MNRVMPDMHTNTRILALVIVAIVATLGLPATSLAATADAGSDETTALGRPVVLDGSASVADPGATYDWQFGDGETTSSTEPTAGHNYRFAGSHTATLTVTDAGGASTDTATVSVEMSATNIDYTKFPSDRNDYLTETSSTRFVSLAGSDSNPGTKASPYRTIQYALSQATSGTVILVRGGHYFTGDIAIDKSNIVLAAYSGEKVVIESSRYGVWEYASGIQLVGPISNVVVDGFDMRHFTNQGVLFGDENTQRNIILKNVIVDDGESGIGTAYTSGTPAKPFIDGLLVKNATLQHISLIGFNAGQTGGGLQLYRNVRLDGVHALMNGRGDNTGADGIAFENGTNVLAENSIAQNASGDGFDFKADNSAVVNSIARHMARNGVKLWSNGQIVNSLVYDTGADAGVVLEAGDFRVVNSAMAWHLKGQTGGAYSMTVGYPDGQGGSSFDSLELFRSIFFEECDRFYVYDAGPGSLAISDNVFNGFGLNRILQYGNADYETTSAINAQSWAGGNTDRDPGFADPDNDDWSIPSGSNGFVEPDLRPRPVVTVVSPGYPNPAGPKKPIRWKKDQGGTYSAEVATNAVNGVGTQIAGGWAVANTTQTVSIPATTPSSGGSRVYIFGISSTGDMGWQSVRVDSYRPRTLAPRYATQYRGYYVRLFYRVDDPYSARAYTKIIVRNSRGRTVAGVTPGWVGTGALRYASMKVTLPRGRYSFSVYATDLALNTQSVVGRNVLDVK